jgi:hypothetical protein
MLLHGSKMRSASEERDIEAGLRHAGADVSADRARTRDQEFHRSIYPRAPQRQRVAEFFRWQVVGMLFDQINFLWTFEFRQDSRQCLISAGFGGVLASFNTTAAATSSPSVGWARSRR